MGKVQGGVDRPLDRQRFQDYAVADLPIHWNSALTDFNDRHLIKWTLLLTQLAGLVAIVTFTLHVAGVGLDQFKPVSLFAGVAAMLSAFASSRRRADSVDPDTRQQAIDRSIRQSASSIPLYAAPVLWVPVVMLLTIWFFMSP